MKRAKKLQLGISPTTHWGICSTPFMSRTLTTDPRDRGTRAEDCASPPTSSIRRTTPWSLGPMVRDKRLGPPQAMWKELEEGAPQEFTVNEALMVEGDPRLHGEVNRFRGKRALVDTLEHLRR